MNVNGSGRDEFPGNRAFGVDPAWSPGGTKIAYTGDTANGARIFTMNTNGTGQAQLTSTANTTQAERQAAYSPDGTRVAFARSVSGQRHLFVINTNGTGEVDISAPNGVDDEPAW